jgi:HK97 family phage portal protein
MKLSTVLGKIAGTFNPSYGSKDNVPIIGITQSVPRTTGMGAESGRRVATLPATDRGFTLAAQFVADVYACAQVRAQNIKAIEIRVVRKGTETEVTDSPWLNMLVWAQEKFNQDLIWLHEYSLSIWGKNFELKLVQGESQLPGGLQWLNPNSVRVDTQSGRLEGFTYSPLGAYMTFQPGQLGYHYYPNVQDDFQGQSPILAALDAVNITRNSQAYIETFFAHDASVGGLITARSRSVQFGSAPVALTDKERDLIMKQWKEQTQGARRSFRTLMLPWDLEYTQYEGRPPTQQVELTKEERRQIHKVLRVPMSLTYESDVADPLSAGNTLSQEEANFFQNFLIPEHMSMLDYYNIHIMPWLAPGHELVGNYESILGAIQNTAERRAMYRDDLQAGVITLTELRDKTGEEELPGDTGDVLYLPHGFDVVPVDKLSTLRSSREIEADRLIMDQMGQAMMDVFTASQMVGLNPALELKDLYWVGSQLVPLAQLPNIWKYGTLMAPSTTNAELLTAQEPEALVVDEAESPVSNGNPGGILPPAPRLDRFAVTDEIRAWQKYHLRRLKTGGERRAWNVEIIPMPWAEEIREGLKEAGDDLEAVQAVFDRALDVAKSIGSRVRAFERVAAALIADARGDSPIPKSRFRNLFRSEIQRFGRLMFSEGLIEGGVTDGVPDAEETSLIKELLQPFTGFVRKFTNRLYAGGVSDAQAALTPIVSANGNMMLEFTGPAGKNPGRTCTVMTGQRHRAKDYRRRQLRPQIDGHNFECGAWQCRHILKPVAGGARGQFPTPTQVRIWANKTDHDHSDKPIFDYEELDYTKSEHMTYLATRGYIIPISEEVQHAN